jgi:hypothetical protein
MRKGALNGRKTVPVAEALTLEQGCGELISKLERIARTRSSANTRAPEVHARGCGPRQQPKLRARVPLTPWVPCHGEARPSGREARPAVPSAWQQA